MDVSVSGGASWPGRIGTATVSIPLARMTATADGLVLDVHSRILRKVLRRFVISAGGSGDPLLSVRWDDIASIDLAPRSVVLHLTNGTGCRFVVMRPAQLAPLVREFEQRDISTRPVRGTVRWFATGSPPA